MNTDVDSAVNSTGKQPIGFAITSLVLGIISIPFSLFLVGGVLGVIGLILGALHLKNCRSFRTMATCGLVLSIIGLACTLGMGSLYYKSYKQYQSIMEEMGGEGTAIELWEGVQAPDITLKTLDGQDIQLSDLKGKRVILDFWATWCPPCVKEIPHFIQLATEISQDELVIIGISSENAETLQTFIEKNGINYSIAVEKDLPSPYADVRSIPTTFFIDRNGVIQSIFSGYHDYDALKKAAQAEDYSGEPVLPPNENDAEPEEEKEE